MAGRWVMSSIQMTFAVMPAAVYWFGGLAIAHGSSAISIGTLVAFTTLQTRLFFPIGSLLSVGIDVQTSLALFDRVFEYLDLPIDIEERPGARRLARAGDVTFERVRFRYGDEWTLRDVTFTVPAGTRTAIVGETGSGKTTIGYLAARLYDVTEGRVAIDLFRELVREAGRDAATVGLEGRVSAATTPRDEWPRHVAWWREAGATHVELNTMGAKYGSIDEHLAALEHFLAVARKP